jgi:hypothetical protein
MCKNTGDKIATYLRTPKQNVCKEYIDIEAPVPDYIRRTIHTTRVEAGSPKFGLNTDRFLPETPQKLDHP